MLTGKRDDKCQPKTAENRSGYRHQGQPHEDPAQRTHTDPCSLREPGGQKPFRMGSRHHLLPFLVQDFVHGDEPKILGSKIVDDAGKRLHRRISIAAAIVQQHDMPFLALDSALDDPLLDLARGYVGPILGVDRNPRGDVSQCRRRLHDARRSRIASVSMVRVGWTKEN